jgi:hypothetical protein
MRPLRPRLVVGFDASSVTGALVSAGIGASRVRAFGHVPLPASALVPGPIDPNVAHPEEVRDALARLVRELDPGRTPATLVVPAAVARIVLLDVPSGVAPREYARYRLLGALPYPPEEAVVDVLELRSGRALGAVARRSVLEGYEQAAEAAGLSQDRLDIAPLAAMSALAGDPGGASVDVILGDTAVCLAVLKGGVLEAFRTRLRDRDADEPRRLALEVERTAAAAGTNGGPVRHRVVGSGAVALLRAWAAEGRSAEPGWRVPDALPVDAAELAWLGSALA